MWWKLGVLAAVTGALLVFLVTPALTMSVTVDIPPGVPAVSGRQMETGIEVAVWIVEAIMVAAILGIAGRIARRIVRKHQMSN